MNYLSIDLGLMNTCDQFHGLKRFWIRSGVAIEDLASCGKVRFVAEAKGVGTG
jgi:hypothetical protein